MVIDNPAKANSNSIAVIKENYEGLDKNNVLQGQPKSEQKFRSQTNDIRKQRIKQQHSDTNPINLDKQGDQIAKKQTVREIIELNKHKASQKSDSLAVDSINNLNVAAQETGH